MKLNIKERLILSLVVAPTEGDVSTLRVMRDLKRALSFSEEELAKWEITSSGEGWKWNATLKPEETEAEISIGPKAHTEIAKILEQKDKDKKLNEDLLDLYDKFCTEKC